VVLESGLGLPDVALTRAQPTDSLDSVAVAENYLLARNQGDWSGAANWCAPLLELQDADDAWFVDQAATADWLRQLMHQYLVETVVEPHQVGNTVTWTERLAQRGEPDVLAGPARMTIEIRAVIRDGKIAYLSGPYPPIPLRTSRAAPGEPAYVTHSNVVSGVPPAVLFLGSALGLGLLVVLVATLGRQLRARPRYHLPPGPNDRLRQT
jgi:hypothetical protein